MAIPPGMHRVTVDIPDSAHAAMQELSLVDKVATSARLRALSVLWQQDPELAARAAALAQQLRVDARRRAVITRHSTMAQASGAAHPQD